MTREEFAERWQQQHYPTMDLRAEVPFYYDIYQTITIYIKGFAPLRKMEARKSMSFMSSKMLKQLKSYGWEIFKGKWAFDLDKAIKDIENLLKKNLLNEENQTL